MALIFQENIHPYFKHTRVCSEEDIHLSGVSFEWGGDRKFEMNRFPDDDWYLSLLQLFQSNLKRICFSL